MKPKRIINIIIESPYLGFWRVCGKDAQRKYRHLNRNDSDVDRDALLKEVVDVYFNGVDNMGIMPMVEKDAKKARVNKLVARTEE